MPLSPPSHLPGMTSRPASQTWTQWLSEVSRGQSPQPKQSLRHDTNTHPRLQNGVVSRAPGALGPGHPEQGPEGEGTVVGTSWGSGADGRPGEGAGRQPPRARDGLPHPVHQPCRQGCRKLSGAPHPPGALLEWAGVGTPGTWGGQTLTRGTGGKEVAPPTQTGSGTSLLGWGQRGP